MASGFCKSITPIILLLFIECFAVSRSSNPNIISDLFPKDGTEKKDIRITSDMYEIENILKELSKKVTDFLVVNGARSLVKLVVSPHCESSILRLIRGLLHLEDWAVRMIDAMGKLSSGILEGTAAALGDFDECLDIDWPEEFHTQYSDNEFQEPVRGQYCMMKFSIPESLKQVIMDYQAGNRSDSPLVKTKTVMKNFVKIAPRADIIDIRLGVCIPSKCAKDDLQKLINTALQSESSGMTVLRCEVKDETKLKLHQIFIMAIFGGITFLVFIGTMVDSIFRCMANELVDDVFMKKQNAYVQFIISFSFYSNFKKLVSLEADDGSLSCVRGIKFISICLSVVVSTYAMPNDFHFLKYRNAFNILKFMDKWWFAMIANASVGVDTLFFVAGLQIAYRIWRKSSDNYKSAASINISKFLVVWYGRLTASQLMVIGLFLLLPMIGSGPLWDDLVTTEIDKCTNTWWMNVLYINNFWPNNETCLYHTWFVSSLMHILIVTPFLLWILNRWNAPGILLILALTFGSLVAIAVVTILKELPAAPAIYFLSFLNLRSTWDLLFIQAYDHVGPFCVGILLGYVLAQQLKIGLRKVTVVLGWFAMSVCNIAILVGLYGYRQDPMTLTLSAVYASLHRTVWSLGIGWVVFACAYGYGGVINDLLSCKMFIPLDRLSNFVYLLHPLIIFFHGGQIRERMYMGNLDQAMYATAYFVHTCVLAALCYVIFYFPFNTLESLLWKEKKQIEFLGHPRVNNKVTSLMECVSTTIKIAAEGEDQQKINETNIGGLTNEAFHH